jgi:flagellar M-ring protein FliF
MQTAAVLNYWMGLPMRTRIAVVGVLAALIVAVSVFSVTRDTQSPLFARPLLPDQLSDVETHLAAWNVPFVADSDNVRLPTKSRNDVLLRLSLAGVPRPHIADSTETLAKVGALTPQSVLDAQSRDGLAGDLSLGLRGITGIADATVIIAPASPGYFADQASHDASASVRLTLEPGVFLSPETVNGIKTFVAAGVPGLDALHVAVVDGSGVALSGRPTTGEGDAHALQDSIQTALDQVLGAGRAIVRAHVDIDGRTNVALETKRTPAIAAPIAHASVDEQYQNGKKHYSKVQSSTDAGSDTVQTETQSAPGTLQRVSIAVFLDQSLAADIPHIRALVETAAGINYARGDTVTVQPIALASAANASPATVTPVSPLHALLATFLPVLPPAIVVLAWLGLMLLLAKPIARIVTSLVPRPLAATGTPEYSGIAVNAALPPEAIHRALSGEPPHTAATVIAGLPTPTAAAVLDLYPSDVRREIIDRLARPRSPLGMDLALDLAGSLGRA